MKRRSAICMTVLLTSLVITSFGSSRTNGQQGEINRQELIEQFVPGRGLVKFRSGIAADHVRQVIAALGARDADEMSGIGVHIADLPFGANEIDFARRFESQPEVEFAELDRLLPPQQLEPNDPVYAISANSWS